ncbi:MAG: hypothetical protein J6X60_00310 [Ruminiclostridium sp.]|nr:hypothetical protein [Ruminiclostridium sp.]
MRNIICLITALFFSIVFFSPACSALYGTDELYDALPGYAAEELEKNGITPEGGTEKVGIGAVLEIIADSFADNMGKPLKMFASVTAVIILSSVMSGMSDAAGMKSTGVYSLISAAASAVVICAYMSDIITVSQKAFSTASDFMLTYVPVLAGVAAAVGHTASAAVYSSVTLTAIQILSRITSAVIIPLTSCMIGITAAGSIDPELNLDRLAEGIKKLITWGLGLIMTLFLGVLSVQSIITASADNAAMKTLKFVVSASVPIVGGSVSEALSSVSGSISILRSGIGGFGIAAGAFMLLAPAVTALCCKFLLFAAGVLSDLFGCTSAGKIIRSGENVMSVILASLVCIFLFITVSSAVLLVFCRS